MVIPTTLVLGIGNTLLTDEGVGIHVINYLASKYPGLPGVDFVDGGTLSFTLAELLADNTRLIVVDAAHLGEVPGTVFCFEDAEMENYLKGNRQSVHEVGLADLLDIARLSEHYPECKALVGIEPQSIDWGEEPTTSVAAAIPEAAEQVMLLLQKWNSMPGSRSDSDDPGFSTVDTS